MILLFKMWALQELKCTPNVRQKCLTFGGVFFMSKYSNEFKLKVIEYCINKHHGYKDAEKHFGVNHEHLRRWIKRYELYGILRGLLLKEEVMMKFSNKM